MANVTDGDDKGDSVASARHDERTDATAAGPLPATAPKAGITFVPGSTIGHTYHVEMLLGRGGMGEVYRTRHVELGTEHAAKIILPMLASEQLFVDLFRREATTLRSVRHDAVVAYEGVSRDENGRLCLVMEFVDGPSLATVMHERPLEAGQVSQLRDRLADALAVAHEKGVIHRDLSPDNIILPDGDIAKAKIIDFGIAKITAIEVWQGQRRVYRVQDPSQ